MLLYRMVFVLLVMAVSGIAGPMSAGGPASAAPALPRLKTMLGPITIAPGTEDFTTDLAGVLAERDDPVRAHRVRYTIDVSDVDDLVTLTFGGYADDIIVASGPSPCALEGSVFRCARSGVRPSAGFVLELGFFEVTSSDTAVPGDSGTIKVTARVDDGPATVSTSVVRIGETVDLASTGDLRVSAAPGRTARISPGVRNAGKATVTGTVLALQMPRELIATDASNCYYEEQVYCVFDRDLVPGRSYALSEPVELRPPADSAQGSRAELMMQWLTTAAWEDWQAMFDGLPGKPGTGDPITLVPAAAAAGLPQVDVNSDQYAGVVLTVTGKHPPKLVVTAPAVTIRPGKKATIRVGVRNDGPGTLRSLFDNNWLMTRIKLPKGVKATTRDRRCLAEYGTTGSFTCWTSEGTIAPGEAVSFAFTVTAGRRFAGGTGTASTGAWVGALSSARTTLRLTVPAGLPITGPAVWPGGLLVAVGALLFISGRDRGWPAPSRRARRNGPPRRDPRGPSGS
ncbi:hypothetical protein [Winogradskya humida]|uniref:Repeat protein (TIGR01451 family) n=1 Tax=Winogradskya humida TaxID=113566 RepID=A0ABQ3ZN10_9ACTN|nr:hypothetical protein [Actinoplanes humidus]GIE19965.1 hypothetical protein Ahu01nite_030670 [Actinoplanes humidus]